jgi:hypothetical protein
MNGSPRQPREGPVIMHQLDQKGEQSHAFSRKATTGEKPEAVSEHPG